MDGSLQDHSCFFLEPSHFLRRSDHIENFRNDCYEQVEIEHQHENDVEVVHAEVKYNHRLAGERVLVMKILPLSELWV